MYAAEGHWTLKLASCLSGYTRVVSLYVDCYGDMNAGKFITTYKCPVIESEWRKWKMAIIFVNLYISKESIQLSLYLTRLFQAIFIVV